MRFIERSFLDADWPEGLGPFDAVVTNQAVHELRHKRRTRGLHAQVLPLLAPGGVYLVCDHFVGEGGMRNDQLYMTVAEQLEAMAGAGFGGVETLKCEGGMALHRAQMAPASMGRLGGPAATH